MKSLILIPLLFLSSVTQGNTLEVNPDRLVRVLGEVNGNILKKANEVMGLAKTSNDPIYIFVNSPGGSVYAGEIFIQSLEIAKSRGIKVECVSTLYAASMAFSILAHCSNRYVLESTRLLFHPARVLIFLAALGAEDAEEIAASLNNINNSLTQFLIPEMGIEKATFDKAFKEERFWKATELVKETKPGWLKVIKDIRGVDDIFAVTPKGEDAKQNTLLKELSPDNPFIFIQAN